MSVISQTSPILKKSLFGILPCPSRPSGRPPTSASRRRRASRGGTRPTGGGLITISSPVWGLRPRRSRFWRTTNVPKPVIWTFSPSPSRPLIESKMISTSRAASRFEMPAVALVDDPGDVGLGHRGPAHASSRRKLVLTATYGLRVQGLYESPPIDVKAESELFSAAACAPAARSGCPRSRTPPGSGSPDSACRRSAGPPGG